MGSPENAKYGFTREQIFAGISELRQKGSRLFGVHTFIASNELNPDYFIDTADMLFDLALEIKGKLRIRIGFVNISGGIGIPYRPDQQKVNLDTVQISPDGTECLISIKKGMLFHNGAEVTARDVEYT